MILHEVEQGSDEWRRLRLGRPTASEFDRILTPTGALSKQAEGYMYRLAAERFLRMPYDDLDPPTQKASDRAAVQRGKKLEHDAALAYEFESGLSLQTAGFATTDDGRVGASLDRRVRGTDGAVEIKCPAAATHIGYLDTGFGRDYWLQVQGQMLVCDLAWVDRVSYYPGLPLAVERAERDEAFIERLRAALAQFCDNLDALTERLRALGAIGAED